VRGGWRSERPYAGGAEDGGARDCAGVGCSGCSCAWMSYAFPQILHTALRETQMRRATGIGGVFFKAKDPKALGEWYRTHLGMNVEEWGGVAFRWAEDNPNGKGTTFGVRSKTTLRPLPRVRRVS
jgi:hypothetical protein